jgi:hypothetical protein
MIQKIIKTTVGVLCMALLTLMGCSDKPHDLPEDMPQEGAGCITIGFNTHLVADVPLQNVHIYVFDANDKFVQHKYYASMQEIALDRLQFELKKYTIYALLNTTPQTTPWEKVAPSVEVLNADNFYIKEFSRWLAEVEKTNLYAGILSGILKHEVKNGLQLIIIDLNSGTGAPQIPDETELTLELTYPSPLLPDFIQVRSGENVRLRAVVEAYKRGTDERVMRKETFVEKVNDQGLHTAKVTLLEGEYDLRIWGDYALEANKDYHYNTANTKNIQILPKESYKANTDSRDCFVQADAITVSGSTQTKALTLTRPLAKYRLVATDLKKYEEIRVKKGYPPLSDLQITVSYDGFLPCGYNIMQAELAGAAEGYAYASTVSDVALDEATICKDYVFVNGTQSSVSVTILLKNAAGQTIGGIKEVKVDYRIGQLTTIRGNFLTAGQGGGIEIDTEWGDDIEVELKSN